MVAFLSGEGMSTRAIAPIVGANNVTVKRDLDLAAVANATPAQPTTGMDGKEYPSRREINPRDFRGSGSRAPLRARRKAA